jgi:hypothetical protein
MAKIPDDIKRQAIAEMAAGVPAPEIARHLTSNGYPITSRSVLEWKNAIFRKDSIPKSRILTPPPPKEFSDIIKRHIEPASGDSVVLAIPDMHHPFCHPDALEFLKAVRDKYQVNKVICMGDEIDAHAFSRYPMDPDGLTAGKEIQVAKETLIPFYREFPDVMICESNHTVRPWKKAFDAGLPRSFLPTYAAILDAPDGWRWQSRWEVDGVIYIHGDAGRSGQYAHIHYVKAFKRSVAIGHIHSYAGVNYEGSHFGINTGCLIDKEAYAFKYAKNAAINVNLGCGIIINGEHAYFIPMLTDEGNRWTGKLA